MAGGKTVMNWDWGSFKLVLSKSVASITLFKIFFFLFGLSLSHSLQLFSLKDFHFLIPPTQTAASSFLLDDLISLTRKGNGVIPSSPDQQSFSECKFPNILMLFFSFIGVRGKCVSSAQRTHLYLCSKAQSLLLSQWILHYFFSLLSIIWPIFSTAFSSNPVVLSRE